MEMRGKGGGVVTAEGGLRSIESFFFHVEPPKRKMDTHRQETRCQHRG